MKLFIVIAVALALNSCNTCIGIGRDTVQGYNWTKGKIEGAQSDDSAGAPVY